MQPSAGFQKSDEILTEFKIVKNMICTVFYSQSLCNIPNPDKKLHPLHFSIRILHGYPCLPYWQHVWLQALLPGLLSPDCSGNLIRCTQSKDRNFLLQDFLILLHLYSPLPVLLLRIPTNPVSFFIFIDDHYLISPICHIHTQMMAKSSKSNNQYWFHFSTPYSILS